MEPNCYEVLEFDRDSLIISDRKAGREIRFSRNAKGRLTYLVLEGDQTVPKRWLQVAYVALTCHRRQDSLASAA